MPYKDAERRKAHHRQYSKAYYFFHRDKILKYKHLRYWYMTREERKAYQRDYYIRNREIINALRRLYNDTTAVMWADIYSRGVTDGKGHTSHDLRAAARDGLSRRGLDPEILLRRRERANYLPCHRTHRPPG